MMLYFEQLAYLCIKSIHSIHNHEEMTRYDQLIAFCWTKLFVEMEKRFEHSWRIHLEIIKQVLVLYDHQNISSYLSHHSNSSSSV